MINAIAFGKLFKTVEELAELANISENEVMAELDDLRSSRRLATRVINGKYEYALKARIA